MAEEVKIASINPSARGVNLVAKVVSKSPERLVASQYDQTEHRITETTIADESGAITLVLWDDNIEKVNEGNVVRVKNGFVKVYRGSMQLNLGRFGTVETVETTMENVNTENNLSQREVPRQYGYGGYGGGYGGGGGGYGGRPYGGRGRGRGRRRE